MTPTKRDGKGDLANKKVMH